MQKVGNSDFGKIWKSVGIAVGILLGILAYSAGMVWYYSLRGEFFGFIATLILALAVVVTSCYLLVKMICIVLFRLLRKHWKRINIEVSVAIGALVMLAVFSACMGYVWHQSGVDFFQAFIAWFELLITGVVLLVLGWGTYNLCRKYWGEMKGYVCIILVNAMLSFMDAWAIRMTVHKELGILQLWIFLGCCLPVCVWYAIAKRQKNTER